MREGLSVFSFLHPAAFPEMTRTLLDKGVAGLSYDLLEDRDKTLPILRPMSEVAGSLSVYAAAQSLQSDRGGRGVLLGGALGIPPAEICVIGGGIAGTAATELSIAQGSHVRLLDINKNRLDYFKDKFGSNITTSISTPDTIAEACSKSDAIIGAVLVPGALAPKLINRTLLNEMRPGAALVDICIDQGGFAESSRPSSILEPTYIENEVVHYCVPNMPALVPRTSTMALTAVTFPFIKELAQSGIENALKSSYSLETSLVTYKGKLINPVVAEALDLPCSPKF